MIDLEQATLFSLTSDRKPKFPWGDLEPGTKAIHPDDVAIGLVTGAKSGVFVLDWDDTSKDPPGPIPETYVRHTRRGYHFYFKVPEGVRVPSLTKFPCEGWDIRGDGGFVVFACDGYGDEVEQPLAECPRWLLERIALYELERMRREVTNHDPLDLETEFGQAHLRQATIDAQKFDVGKAGTRDQQLFLAANQMVRVRRMPVDVAVKLLVEHYAPRVPEDGQDTVSPTRIEYKCLEAARTGTWEFQPFTDEHLAMWREAARPVQEAARREKYGLIDPSQIPARPSDSDYRPLFARDMVPSTSKQDKANITNLTNIFATHHAWLGRLGFDEFAQEFRVYQPPVQMENKGFFSREDVTICQMWLSAALNIQAGPDMTERALALASRDNTYHPVREYLAGLQPVEDPRAVLEDFAVLGLGATDPIVVNYIKKFMIGAVRRVLEPGVKMDGVLVLKGEQNTGKSSLLYALSPERRWVQESLPDLRNKDAQEALRGRWLVEIAELQAVLRQEEAVAKDFLSRQEDSYRRPYDKGTSRNPRQCVFIATTNDDEILRDPTGARRYWIVETQGINLSWVQENRDAIWSAALALALSGEAHQLTLEEIKAMQPTQEMFQEVDPWQDHIEKFLTGKEFVKSVADIFLGALQGEGPKATEGLLNEALLKMNNVTQRRIANVLRRLGWKKLKRGGYLCGWYPPGQTMKKVVTS